jgi:hypothetical protein
MDFVKNAMGGGNNNNNNNENAGQNQQASGSGQKSEGGFLGGIGDKLNSAAGGGEAGEKKEDYLDKGMQHYLDWQASPSLTFSHRRRLRPGELHGSGQAGQRERH